MSITLSASILSSDFSRLGEQIREAEAGGVDWIHVDVMDGHFVPTITMGPFIVETCRRITKLPLDVHLMVEKPERHLADFANSGATNILVQVETCPHLYHTLQVIRSMGCHPGVVLNPGTPAISLTNVLSLVDQILVMTVNPGASGQEFLSDMMPKVREVSKMLADQNLSAQIEVDGGVTSTTLPLAYQAGARIFVSASSIFKDPLGIHHGIQSLRSSISN